MKRETISRRCAARELAYRLGCLPFKARREQRSFYCRRRECADEYAFFIDNRQMRGDEACRIAREYLRDKTIEDGRLRVEPAMGAPHSRLYIEACRNA